MVREGGLELFSYTRDHLILCGETQGVRQDGLVGQNFSKEHATEHGQAYTESCSGRGRLDERQNTNERDPTIHLDDLVVVHFAPVVAEQEA